MLSLKLFLTSVFTMSAGGFMLQGLNVKYAKTIAVTMLVFVGALLLSAIWCL